MTTNQVVSPQVSKPGHLVDADLGQVCQPDHQVEVAVPARDQRVPAEHDRLPSVRRLRELGKHDAGHASLEFYFYNGIYSLIVVNIFWQKTMNVLHLLTLGEIEYASQKR